MTLAERARRDVPLPGEGARAPARRASAPSASPKAAGARTSSTPTTTNASTANQRPTNCSPCSATCSRKRPMRPLELTIEGFRSYRGATTFDWRDRRLVGIVGPIGAGKSSILDAVAFALYGKTPGIGSATKSLIHQLCDRGARLAHVRGRRPDLAGGAGAQAQGPIGPSALAPGRGRARRRDARDRHDGRRRQRTHRAAARHGLRHVLPVGPAGAEPVQRLPEGHEDRARQGAEGRVRLRTDRCGQARRRAPARPRDDGPGSVRPRARGHRSGARTAGGGSRSAPSRPVRD